MSGKSEQVPVRFAWPDERALLARVLPVILRASGVERLVVPGAPVLLPFTPVTVIAVVPGSMPLVAEIDRGTGDLLTLPFPTEAVLAAVATSHREEEQHGTVAFSVDAWLADLPGPAETSELTVALDSGKLRIASWPGEHRASAPSRLVVAARTTPTRIVAVPSLGPGEIAVVDLAAERPFGHRPALVPSDPRSRLLLAYLSAGQHKIARALAVRLVTVLGEQRPIAWSEPSLVQLLVGYSLAAAQDGPALAGWCRRTRADRLLGADGAILAAIAAWHQQQPRDAARLLLCAGQAGAPVMSFGLESAVRLAYLLLALEIEREALDRLVTAYSVLSSRSDPIADTVTTPTSARRPVSLQGRGALTRTRWALAYLAARTRLPHVVRSAAGAVHIVLDPPAAGDIRSSTRHRGVSMNFVSSRRESFPFRWLVLALLVAWLAVVAAVVVVGISDKGNWERLLAPFGVLGAAVFILLGVAISDARGEDRREQELELVARIERAELRVREVEEEAMKGRALAAALQAEAGPEANRDVIRHARFSRRLFGDLVGEEHLNSDTDSTTA